MKEATVELRTAGKFEPNNAGYLNSLGIVFTGATGESKECISESPTAEEGEIRGLPDPEVLARASGDGRTLVTHDRRTMPAHFADFIRQKESPGVIIVSQRVSVVRAIEERTLVWEASRGEEWVKLIVELPL